MFGCDPSRLFKPDSADHNLMQVWILKFGGIIGIKESLKILVETMYDGKVPLVVKIKPGKAARQPAQFPKGRLFSFPVKQKLQLPLNMMSFFHVQDWGRREEFQRVDWLV